ncbi:MAG: TetR/AcrR family transcriptional regulator [Pseudomonadales bacterium]|nr:TetR/AcrR family transcriptional regulator [Pseudomonadales bacterium]
MPRQQLSETELNEGRKKILAVAMKLFSEQGYKGVTARSIAKLLGWSSMKSYRYYESKLAIFVAVRERAFTNLTIEMQNASEAVKDPLDKLYASGYAYVKFALDNPHEYDLCFKVDDQGEMENYQLMSPAAVSPWDLAVENYAVAKQAGYLKGDSSLAAHIGWISLHGLVTLQLANRLNFNLSVEDLVDPVLDCVISRFSANRQKVPRRTKRRTFSNF